MRAVSLNPSAAALRRPRWTRLLRPAVLGEFLLRLWQASRERRRLAELDPRLLRDIGVDPMAAQYEVRRPFWQLPEHHEAQLERRLAR